MHQLCIQIEGYQPIKPVTIDKVGIYIRHADFTLLKNQKELPPARVVFDVALEGSARKLITIRSALLIKNKLPEKMEIKLESNFNVESSSPKCFILNPNVTLAVPIVHTHSLISVRPFSNKLMYTFSQQISWEIVTRANEVMHEMKACNTNRGYIYRFCSEIKRDNYPPDKTGALVGMFGQWAQPGHVITLVPAVLIVNLLPIDLMFKISGVSGRIPGGNELAVTYVGEFITFNFLCCISLF